MSTGNPKFPPMPTVIAGTNAAPASAVTATLGYVSPTYHAEVVARLEARVAELKTALTPFAIEGCDPMCSEGCAYCDAARALRGGRAVSVSEDPYADAMARGYAACRELALAALHEWPAIQAIVTGKLGSGGSENESEGHR